MQEVNHKWYGLEMGVNHKAIAVVHVRDDFFFKAKGEIRLYVSILHEKRQDMVTSRM